MTIAPAGLLVDGPADASASFVFAHGAGAPMDAPFMEIVAAAVGEAGIRVVRFEFPYMAERRRSGKRPGPNPPRVLMRSWLDVIAELGDPRRLVIGGKSMGGRIASMVADEAGVLGLVCLGYPFHPAGRPERLRTEHLATLRTPTLILQGERDAFGRPEEVAGYELAPTITVRWVSDGNHSFKSRKTSGRTERQNLDESSNAIVEFVRERLRD